jgi:hypothetical protein
MKEIAARVLTPDGSPCASLMRRFCLQGLSLECATSKCWAEEVDMPFGHGGLRNVRRTGLAGVATICEQRY